MSRYSYSSIFRSTYHRMRMLEERARGKQISVEESNREFNGDMPIACILREKANRTFNAQEVLAALTDKKKAKRIQLLCQASEIAKGLLKRLYNSNEGAIIELELPLQRECCTIERAKTTEFVNVNQKTFAKVIMIIMEQLGVEEDEIRIESNFVDDLGADSLDIVELVMAVEEEFDFEISDEDAEKIRTVGELVQYIDKHEAA